MTATLPPQATTDANAAAALAETYYRQAKACVAKCSAANAPAVWEGFIAAMEMATEMMVTERNRIFAGNPKKGTSDGQS